MSTSAGYYRVRQGDWLAKIADDFGIPDWQTVWNHPSNAELRDTRQSPNILMPGDRLFIPAITAKETDASSDQKHQFVKSRQKIHLRVQLFDADKSPRKGLPYTLKAGKQTLEGCADGQGLVFEELEPNLTSAVLQVENEVILLRLGHLDPIYEMSGIQGRLVNLGYDPGEVDGIYGPKTKRAIMAFQQECPPLAVDGVCGPKTRQKLLEIHGC
jgi:N-acetylmuramoyl-L-alanine amidase